MAVTNESVAQSVRAPQTPTELLFQPVKLGRYNLPHRIAMAPLTRSRARQPGNVPSALNACYYAQRASAALIISEATQVSMQGQGYAWTPGIHSREQIEGWRLVTGAVHGAVRPDLHAALARRTYLASAPAARRHAASRAFRDQTGGRSVHRERERRGCAGAVRDPARPADRRDALHRAPVRARREERNGSRVSMASRSTPPTAICSTSSSTRAPTSAPTRTAARSRIGRGC